LRPQGEGSGAALACPHGSRHASTLVGEEPGGSAVDYTPHTEEDVRAMLAAIGAESVDELFAPIPPAVRLQGDLRLPPPVTEAEVVGIMEDLSRRNRPIDGMACFAGGSTRTTGRCWRPTGRVPATGSTRPRLPPASRTCPTCRGRRAWSWPSRTSSAGWRTSAPRPGPPTTPAPCSWSPTTPRRRA